MSFQEMNIWRAYRMWNIRLGVLCYRLLNNSVPASSACNLLCNYSKLLQSDIKYLIPDIFCSFLYLFRFCSKYCNDQFCFLFLFFFSIFSRQELAGELDKDWQLQEASFKIIEEFNHLKSEKVNCIIKSPLFISPIPFSSTQWIACTSTIW